MNLFKLTAISLIPNFKTSDIFYSLSLIVRPHLFWSKKPQKDLIKQLKIVTQNKSVFLFDSGRTSLYFLLKSLDITKGDEVILQAFTCSVVPGTILQAYGTPIFVDIDSTFNLDSSLLEKSITKKTKAVIIQHTFGTPAQIDNIKTICQKHKIFLIEDCAHGFGNTYQNKPLGSFGDAAIFSFGRDKVISGIWGGALATNNSVLAAKIKKNITNLPEHNFWWTFKTLKYIPLMSIIINTYYFLNLGKITHFIFRRLRILPDAITRQEKQSLTPAIFYKNLPSPICLLVSYQLSQIDSFIDHHRLLAKNYSEKLKTKFDSQSSYLRYSISIDNPKDLITFAAKNKIILGDWYSTIIAPKDIDSSLFGYKSGSCPKAEITTTKIVNLPTNPNFSLVDTTRIINIIKQWKSKKS